MTATPPQAHQMGHHLADLRHHSDPSVFGGLCGCCSEYAAPGAGTVTLMRAGDGAILLCAGCSRDVAAWQRTCRDEHRCPGVWDGEEWRYEGES